MEGTAAQADFCFVHFTDTHMMVGNTSPKLDTSASLQRVIEVLTALEPRPAFAVIGGDLVSPDLLDRSRTLTQEEYEPSYHLLRELVSPLQCPTYMLLGNHDHRQAFHHVMQTPVQSLDTTHHYSRQGLTMLTTPATCFQVSKVSQTFKTLPGPPGFRLVWIKGGEFSTRVLHLHGDGLAAL